MAEPEPLSERYRQIAIQIGQALSLVAITFRALDEGETDLELQAAEVLEHAAEMLVQLSSDSSGMWMDVRKLEERAGEGVQP